MLLQLNNAKLEYLKASDQSNDPKDKRFLNLQSTFRNRFFQDITKLLRSLNIELDSLNIHLLNYEQMVISTFKKSNHTHLQKCIDYDRKLLKLYQEALELRPDVSELLFQQDKISESMVENVYFLESVGLILEP